MIRVNETYGIQPSATEIELAVPDVKAVKK